MIGGRTPGGSRGAIDPLPVERLRVPSRVELDGDSLVWEFGPKVRRVPPPPSLLPEFLALADAPGERIRDFARRWGVLETCEHKLPSTHRPTVPEAYGPNAQGQSAIRLEPGCVPLDAWVDNERSSWGGRDLIESWEHFARQGRALLSVAHRLQLNQTIAISDLQVIHEWEPEFVGTGWKRLLGSPKRLWQLVGSTVGDWMRLGDVRPFVVMRSNGEFGDSAPLDLRLGDSMFGTLAVRLLLVATRSVGLAICKSCGASFIPRRRPRPDRRSYCPSCGHSAAMRDAARDYRQRKETAAGLHSQGLDVEDIAKRLGSRREAVRSWLSPPHAGTKPGDRGVRRSRK